MDLGILEPIVRLAWLVGAVGVRPGPHPDELAGHGPERQPPLRGGMSVAVIATAFFLAVRPSDSDVNVVGWAIIVAGIALGGGLGLYTAKTVKMTAMPQLVSLFNAVGGGAAALIAINDYLGLSARPHRSGERRDRPRHRHRLDHVHRLAHRVGQAHGPEDHAVEAGDDPGRPARDSGAGGDRRHRRGLPLGRQPSVPVMFVILAAALIFGVTMALPIGGADMPVVISLLNSFTGTAVAMAGFVLGNPVLIIAGALVGASGAILTKLMADAMNRSVINIMVGGFGGGEKTS